MNVLDIFGGLLFSGLVILIAAPIVVLLVILEYKIAYFEKKGADYKYKHRTLKYFICILIASCITGLVFAIMVFALKLDFSAKPYALILWLIFIYTSLISYLIFRFIYYIKLKKYIAFSMQGQ